MPQRLDKSIFLLFGLLLFFKTSPVFSKDFLVADVFGDNMVLQSGAGSKIWGNGKAGDNVTVTIDGKEKFTTIDESGNWIVELPILRASFEPKILRVQGTRTIEFKNILFGDVWYASGQSNMDWRLKQCVKKENLFASFIDNSELTKVRYRSIKTRHSKKTLDQIGDKGGWEIAGPNSAPHFSAVAYLFANRLAEELNRPIGILESSWGGHPIEPFIPVEAFQGHSILEEELRLSKLEDLPGLKEMVGGVWARDSSWLAGRIFNSRVAPVTSFRLKGFIWYQAESNCGTGEDPRFYHLKMEALVRGWRQAWGDNKLPFYFVQLPQYPAHGWTLMRDEQRRFLSSLQGAGMAVTVDLKLDEIHPTNKLDVAERLAALALSKTYKRDSIATGPLFNKVNFDGERAIVTFDNSLPALVRGKKRDYRPVEFSDDPSINGFEVLSEKGSWHKAEARIVRGEKVVCFAHGVKNPKGVRYGWSPTMPTDAPWNLYNKAGFPASPFNSLSTERIYKDVNL